MHRNLNVLRIVNLCHYPVHSKRRIAMKEVFIIFAAAAIYFVVALHYLATCLAV
ncbi:MAG: hypothetical protein ACYC9O_01860 [Candidatus Latescibacterota bacterium]